MKILITGAFGQLGRALQKRLCDGNELILTATEGTIVAGQGFYALDITDETACGRLITTIQPDVVINCAAFTAVDACEQEQEGARAVNATGVGYLARFSKEVGAKFVQISTDYVFDGEAKKPYGETDTPHPLSVYGQTKLEGEELALACGGQVFVVRTAWLYGEGQNFVKSMLRHAAAGHALRVVEDQYGSPTSATVLADILAFLIQTEATGIYHGVCRGETNRYAFAKRIFEIKGIQADLTPIPTDAYPLPARRPLYAPLDNQKLVALGYTPQGWEEALSDYLKSLTFSV